MKIRETHEKQSFQRENNRIQGHRAMFFYLGIVLLVLFSCSLTSAWDWDNVKEFEKEDLEYGKITVYNAFNFPIIGSKLAEYTLIDNTDQCLINCYAEGIAILYDSEQLFSNLNFYNKERQLKSLKDNKILIQKNISFEVNIPEYYEVCEYDDGNKTDNCHQEILGSHKETKYKTIWKDYNDEILEEGEYYWRVQARKQRGENIDWIGSAFGEDFTEWAWWNESWIYKIPINVSVSSGSTLQNHPIKLMINTTNLYELNKLNESCKDIRFTNSTELESTELDYWVKTCVTNDNNTNSEIWVEIDQNITTTNYTIYMYYNNLNAESASNGTNTFDFFDDFSSGSIDWTNLWASGSQGDFTVTADNRLELNGTGTAFGDQIYTQTSFGYNYSWHYEVNFSTTDATVYAGIYEDEAGDARVDFLSDRNPRYTKTDDSTPDIATYPQSPTNLYEVEFSNYDTNSWRFNITNKSGTGHVSTTATDVKTYTDLHFTVLRFGVGDVAYFDNFFVRKYVDPEPLYYFGEEKAVATIIPYIYLNATSINNYSADNLTCHYEIIPAAAKAIINWNKSGLSITSLNMPFEGGSNSTWTKDYSGQGNDGIVVNAIWSSVGGYDGKGAYVFDGDGDYINLGDDDSIEFTSDFTLSAWVKGNNFSNHYIFAKGASSDNYKYELRMFAGSLGFYTYENATATDVHCGAVDTSPLQIGEWAYLTAVYKASEGCFLYVNGTHFANDTSLSGIIRQDTTEDLYIGARGTLDYWNGTIDDILMFNKSLSEEKIKALYENRTDLIVSQETSVGDVWSCEIIPNNGAGDGDINISNNLTILSAPPEVTLNYPLDNANLTNKTTTFDCFVNDDGNSLANTTLYLNDLLNETNSSGIDDVNYTFQKVLVDGDWNWTCGACDTGGLCTNATARTFILDTIPALVNATSPTGNQGEFTVGMSLDLNWTASDIHLESCWYEYNNTNTTLTCGDNYTVFNVTNKSDTSLTFYANDTFGWLNSSTTTWFYTITKENESFNNLTYETKSETFQVNVTLETDYTIFSVLLVYNNTNYTISDIQSFGLTYQLTRTIDIPLNVNPFTNQTNSFYWRFVLVDPEETQIIQELEPSNQTVYFINLQLCNTTYSATALNFTYKDEFTKEQINASLNATDIGTTFFYWLGSGGVQRNYSYENLSNSYASQYGFCIHPHNYTFRTDMDMEYEAEDYSPRTYYLRNASLTNTSNDIDLMLLLTDYSVKFFVTVKQGEDLFTDAIVSISKYFTEEGRFRSIGIRRTDDRGRFIEYFDIDKNFQFSFVKDGVSYGVIERWVTCMEAPCELDLQIEEVEIDLWKGYYDTFAQNIAYTLIYNDTTGIVTFTFTDLTGLAQYFQLVVEQTKYNVTDVVICDETVYTTFGTLTCNISSYEGYFTAYTYVSRSPRQFLDYLKLVRQTVKDIFGATGILIAFFIIVTIALVGAWNPAVGVALTALSIVAVSMIGFVALGQFSIMAIIVLAVIIIIKMKV